MTTTIVACVDWVDLHPEIDQLTGAVTTDARRNGFSASDQAAVETALRLAESASTRGASAQVVIISVAPSAGDDALRELAASGATRALRIDPAGTLSAASVGRALAAAIADLENVSLVLCGDYAMAWGSGAVPGFVAHHLGFAQALGVVEVAASGSAASTTGLEAVRRLDGGRREVLTIDGPAVVSVEGSVARLRRAPLAAVMAWKKRDIETAGIVAASPAGVVVESTEPIRPRARAFAAPHGDIALQRIVELTGALVERTPPRRVEAEPVEAAAVIVDQLRSWGYLET